MRKRYLVIASAVVLICLVAGGWWLVKLGTNDTTNVQEFTRLDITLEGGKLTTAASTYVVKPGVGLEFHITSDTFGKISVPTEPPQTITFTASPLIFKFNAPITSGSRALLYLPEGSDQAIQIGTIVVRDS